eukprot:13102162-Ditylum_brightwellii.AAC.1
MCVQLSARGATSNYPVNEIGTKVKLLLLKLVETHGDNTFTVYSEKEKHLKVATFSNDAKKVKSYNNTMLKIGGTGMSHYYYMLLA